MKVFWLFIKIIPAAFLSIIILFGCNNEKGDEDKEVLAKVYGNYLYLEDISDMLPNGLNKEDSLEVIRNKTDMWVRKQLLLNQANAALTEEQKDVEQIVKDYRASLLIDIYKQEFLKQKLDTVADAAEIRNYYNSNIESFLLSREIIKGYYVKIPVDNSNYNQVRSLSFSSDEGAADKLSEIAASSDFQFVDFRNKWQSLSEFTDRMPQTGSRYGESLKNRDMISTRDNEFFYILRLKDVRLTGEPMPFDQAEEQIKILLINKQKNELLNELERSVYQNALNKGDLEIFLN